MSERIGHGVVRRLRKARNGASRKRIYINNVETQDLADLLADWKRLRGLIAAVHNPCGIHDLMDEAAAIRSEEEKTEATKYERMKPLCSGGITGEGGEV